MSWQLFIRAAAKRDIQEARDWYRDNDAGLPDQFRLDLTKTLVRLVKSPNRSPPYYGPYYRILFKRFPFKIFYRLIGEKIVVFRILHVSRDHTRELPNG